MTLWRDPDSRLRVVSAIDILERLGNRLRLTGADRQLLIALLRWSGGADTCEIAHARLAVEMGWEDDGWDLAEANGRVRHIEASREVVRHRIVDRVGRRMARLLARLVDRDRRPLIEYRAGTRSRAASGWVNIPSTYVLTRLWDILAQAERARVAAYTHTEGITAALAVFDRLGLAVRRRRAVKTASARAAIHRLQALVERTRLSDADLDALRDLREVIDRRLTPPAAAAIRLAAEQTPREQGAVVSAILVSESASAGRPCVDPADLC